MSRLNYFNFLLYNKEQAALNCVALMGGKATYVFKLQIDLKATQNSICLTFVRSVNLVCLIS